MTPENIHLNSFMYEPIMDMSPKNLKTALCCRKNRAVTQNTSIILYFMPQTHELAQFDSIKPDYHSSQGVGEDQAQGCKSLQLTYFFEQD